MLYLFLLRFVLLLFPFFVFCFSSYILNRIISKRSLNLLRKYYASLSFAFLLVFFVFLSGRGVLPCVRHKIDSNAYPPRANFVSASRVLKSPVVYQFY